MRSVDTNIVVRLLTADDERQFRKAKKIFAGGDIWVAKTVLLETEWVLRSKYAFAPNAVLKAIRGLLALDNVSVEDETAIGLALDLLEKGFDFADALHLASHPQGAKFVTFDEELVRRAKRAGLSNVVEA